MKISILPIKYEFYPGETISGKIHINTKENTYIEDIEMSLSFSEDWNYLLPDKKYETMNNKQCIATFKIGISNIILEQNKSSFPFKTKLPDYLLPSFEFPKEKFRAFLRYSLKAKIKSFGQEMSSIVYIIIKSIPNIDNKNLIGQDASLSVKKSEMFNRGQTTLQVSYLSKNYTLYDNIPLEIEINNINSSLKVEKCKFYIFRKLIFKNELFVDKYVLEDLILKSKYKRSINKNEKLLFNYSLDLKTISYKDFKPKGVHIPYENIQFNLIDFLPSIDGNIISCEYCLKIKLKLSHKVPKEELPTLVIPIYIVHKLNKDDKEIVKKAAEKIKENEKKKIYENVINEFGNIDHKNKNVITVNNEGQEERVENDINDIIDEKNENKPNGNVVENKYDLINLDVKFDNDNNPNNNDKKNENNFLNKSITSGNKIENDVNNKDNKMKNKINNKSNNNNDNNGKKENDIKPETPGNIPDNIFETILVDKSIKSDYTFNVLLVGESDSGKDQFLLGFFSDNYYIQNNQQNILGKQK